MNGLTKFAALFGLAAVLGGGMSGIATAQWCWDADDVFANVIGSTVIIHHDAALYNCCADAFEYDLDMQGSTVTIQENEIAPNPCYCICCNNLAVTIEDVPTGQYHVDFHWFDYERDRWEIWVLDVEVPEVGQSGEPRVTAVAPPLCRESSDTPEDGSPDGEARQGTWGRVKSLCR